MRKTLVLSTMLAAGCTVGPNFKQPGAPSVSGYVSPQESGAKNAIALGAKVQADWWTLFHNQAIDDLVQQAIAGSPTLDAAKARLASAQETIAKAESALYPQASFGASVTRERLSTTEFGLTPSQFALPPNFNLFQVGPSASYSLDLWGGTRRQIEARTAQAEWQRQQLEAAYVTLTGNVVTQAVALADADAQLKAVHDIYDLDTQNLKLVGTERLAGERPDTDVIEAESQLATDKTLLPAPEQAQSAARHALAVLTGRLPGNWSPPAIALDQLTLPEPLPVSLPSELVHQRPDILASEAELHAASAMVGVATAQLYPQVMLSASAGLAALDPGDLFNPEAVIWSMASGLTQPLFDGGLRKAERQQALDNFKASAADYRQTVLEAFGQVADILQALDHDGELLASEQQALDLAQQTVKLQRISYQAGETGVLDLLDAQRRYQQARMGYVRAESQRYRDAVQLLVAMGGGWWEAGK